MGAVTQACPQRFSLAVLDGTSADRWIISIVMCAPGYCVVPRPAPWATPQPGRTRRRGRTPSSGQVGQGPGNPTIAICGVWLFGIRPKKPGGTRGRREGCPSGGNARHNPCRSGTGRVRHTTNLDASDGRGGRPSLANAGSGAHRSTPRTGKKSARWRPAAAIDARIGQAPNATLPMSEKRSRSIRSETANARPVKNIRTQDMRGNSANLGHNAQMARRNARPLGYGRRPQPGCPSDFRRHAARQSNLFESVHEVNVRCGATFVNAK